MNFIRPQLKTKLVKRIYNAGTNEDLGDSYTYLKCTKNVKKIKLNEKDDTDNEKNNKLKVEMIKEIKHFDKLCPENDKNLKNIIKNILNILKLPDDEILKLYTFEEFNLMKSIYQTKLDTCSKELGELEKQKNFKIIETNENRLAEKLFREELSIQEKIYDVKFSQYRDEINYLKSLNYNFVKKLEACLDSNESLIKFKGEAENVEDFQKQYIDVAKQLKDCYSDMQTSVTTFNSITVKSLEELNKYKEINENLEYGIIAMENEIDQLRKFERESRGYKNCAKRVIELEKEIERQKAELELTHEIIRQYNIQKMKYNETISTFGILHDNYAELEQDLLLKDDEIIELQNRLKNLQVELVGKCKMEKIMAQEKKLEFKILKNCNNFKTFNFIYMCPFNSLLHNMIYIHYYHWFDMDKFFENTLWSEIFNHYFDETFDEMYNIIKNEFPQLVSTRFEFNGIYYIESVIKKLFQNIEFVEQFEFIIEDNQVNSTVLEKYLYQNIKVKNKTLLLFISIFETFGNPLNVLLNEIPKVLFFDDSPYELTGIIHNNTTISQNEVNSKFLHFVAITRKPNTYNEYFLIDDNKVSIDNIQGDLSVQPSVYVYLKKYCSSAKIECNNK